MKTKLLAGIAIVAAIFGFTGCASTTCCKHVPQPPTLRYMTMSPSGGVVIINPPGPGSGTTVLGRISVRISANQTVPGASWKVSSGVWHLMPTLWPLTKGNYTVSFSPVAGYTAPNPVSVKILKGATTELIVSYGTNSAALQ